LKKTALELDAMIDQVAYEDLSDLLACVDFLRQDACQKLEKGRKTTLGQFLTPASVADLMASMLECRTSSICILDAGAGVGSLFAACVANLCNREKRPEHISVTTYEIDEVFVEYLQETFHLCETLCNRVGIQFTGEVVQRDFIEDGVELLRGTLFPSTCQIREQPHFTCAILNPPYRKIQSESRERKLLRQLGIETSNLYTGFLALAMQLLAPSGELVAITPRSFCNGPYFKSFRESFLKTMALHRIHIFESRQQAFHEDEVLQENIILHAIKGEEKPDTVTITSSTAPDDDFVLVNEVNYSQVVHPKDPQSFIHIVPDDLGRQIAGRMAKFHASLPESGLHVSTGRVVDFRAEKFLREQPEAGTAPLIFPAHCRNGHVIWPQVEGKKPNAIVIAEPTKALLVPNEHYVLVKRFSSKEEQKRIVAVVYNAECIPGTSVGFENHLNYFHRNGKGLSLTLARGLAGFLNSSLVDSYFRHFNGHTQVNATDLRNIHYPTLEQLETLGSRISTRSLLQKELDQIVKEVLLSMPGIDAGTQEEDPISVKQRIEEAITVLKALGFPRGQQNERSALTLLALLDLKPHEAWSEAQAPLRGITPMMEFFKQFYGKNYAPNTRETVRRQTVHQFLEAGLITANPDQPERPVNSPEAVYQIEHSAFELLCTFGTSEWEMSLHTYLSSIDTLKTRYAQERAMLRIPVSIAPGMEVSLSPGGQNILIEQIIKEFASRYTPGGKVLYIGDTANKFAYFDENGLRKLGVSIEIHGKVPDVVIYHADKNWLVLIEAVTSHGPIDAKRKEELEKLFQGSNADLVFVTAFLTRSAMVEYLRDISWETEVWVAEAPSHLIHFNGAKFLGPYEKK
jgi:adenine-specific DNA-methyltransferase